MATFDYIVEIYRLKPTNGRLNHLKPRSAAEVLESTSPEGCVQAFFVMMGLRKTMENLVSLCFLGHFFLHFWFFLLGIVYVFQGFLYKEIQEKCFQKTADSISR